MVKMSCKTLAIEVYSQNLRIKHTSKKILRVWRGFSSHSLIGGSCDAASVSFVDLMPIFFVHVLDRKDVSYCTIYYKSIIASSTICKTWPNRFQSIFSL